MNTAGDSKNELIIATSGIAMYRLILKRILRNATGSKAMESPFSILLRINGERHDQPRILTGKQPPLKASNPLPALRSRGIMRVRCSLGKYFCSAADLDRGYLGLHKAACAAHRFSH
jgi:hypothetical protein